MCPGRHLHRPADCPEYGVEPCCVREPQSGCGCRRIRSEPSWVLNLRRSRGHAAEFPATVPWLGKSAFSGEVARTTVHRTAATSWSAWMLNLFQQHPRVPSTFMWACHARATSIAQSTARKNNSTAPVGKSGQHVRVELRRRDSDVGTSSSRSRAACC